MKITAYILILFLIIAILAWVYIYFFYSGKKTTAEIEINGKKIKAELADTSVKRLEGLSKRKELPNDSAMLFVFPKKDKHTIWMKEMNFPLDIIWINKNKVVYLVSGAQPPTIMGNDNIASFTPEVKADKVLEVNSGFVESNRVKIGDRIIIRN